MCLRKYTISLCIMDGYTFATSLSLSLSLSNIRCTLENLPCFSSSSFKKPSDLDSYIKISYNASQRNLLKLKLEILTYIKLLKE